MSSPTSAKNSYPLVLRLSGLTAEVMKDHIRNQVIDPVHEKGAADLVEMLRTYLK